MPLISHPKFASGGLPKKGELYIEYMPLSDLKKAKRNPKRHQIQTIYESINRFGYNSPMIMDERTKALVAGHGRKKSLENAKAEGKQPPKYVRIENGEWFVSVVRGVSFANDQEAEAYLLADNETTIQGGWDDSELQQILRELNESAGLLGTGFEDFFRGQDLIQDDPSDLIDQAAELQKKWKTAHGQVWLIPSTAGSGVHRLLCGSSTNPEDVRRLMNGKRASLFATDPPYLVNYDGTNHPHRWNHNDRVKRRKNKNWRDKYSDVDSPELGEALYEAFVNIAIEHAITENAAWYCWHASVRQPLLQTVWERHGALVHQQIVWVKDRPILTRSYYMWQHEPCLFGWLKGHKPKRLVDDYPSTVWSFPTIRPGATTTHPTEKPIELFAIPIRQHTDKNDLCYEAFAGSGTQLVAAESLGRICYAMELSPPFVAVALERLAAVGLKPVLQR